MERNESLTPEYTCLFNGLTDTIQEVEALLLKLKRLQAAAKERVIVYKNNADLFLSVVSFLHFIFPFRLRGQGALTVFNKCELSAFSANAADFGTQVGKKRRKRSRHLQPAQIRPFGLLH